MSTTKQSSVDTTQSVWSRMFTPGSNWDKDNEDFLDVIYWGRQLVAIIIGMIWGYLGIQGITGITSFAVVNSFIVYVYSIKINNNQDDTFEYIKEGFMTAFASFMVAWIMTYSYIYY